MNKNNGSNNRQPPSECQADLDILILANGKDWPVKKLGQLRRNRFVIALDGAANLAMRQNWDPDLILGDLDSVSKKALRHFRARGVPIGPTRNQNYTDLEKALLWLQEFRPRSILVALTTQDRFDHFWMAIQSLKKYRRIPMQLASPNQIFTFAKNQTVSLTSRKKSRCAVLAISSCRVSSEGLQYEMKNYRLRFGEKQSVSNRVNRSGAKISVAGEALIVEEWK